MIVLYVIIGLVMLVGGAELLVRGGSHVAIAAKVPILVVGLTLVAFGTSTPELAVSVTAANTPHGEMALANVNGSNVANILLVLGLAAVVRPLAVDRRLMQRRDLAPHEAASSTTSGCSQTPWRSATPTSRTMIWTST